MTSEQEGARSRAADGYRPGARAKIALGDLVAALSAVRAVALAADAPSIGSSSLLYALIDPKRRNRPSAAQLRDAAAAARAMIRGVAAAADAAQRQAERMDRRESADAV